MLSNVLFHRTFLTQIGGADKTWWDFRPLFRTRADRARMWMVVLIGAFGQLSGNGMSESQWILTVSIMLIYH